MSRKRTREDVWPALVIVGLAFTFLLAWLLMLIVGALFPQAGVAYWQTLLGILGLRLMVAAVRR